MSIELTQKLVAGTLIVGGLGGGYYALTGGSSYTLANYHQNEGRELATNWDTVLAEYDKEENQDLIDGIKQKASKTKDNIKNWCESKGKTYYIGPTDKTYQNYSLYCLVHANLDTVLTKKGYQWKDESDKWDKKFEKYQASGQGFLTPATATTPARGPKSTIPPAKAVTPTKDMLIQFCKDAKAKRYKYHGDKEEYETRVYCYWSQAQLEEANKPAVPTSPDSQSI